MSSTIQPPPAAGAASPAASGDQLHRRSLGTAHLVFFIVAASAPLTAVAGGQAATYLVTGNQGIPFLFIPLAIILGTFAVGYAAMSHHVADAGAFYTYVARGLGKIPGVGTAFGALVSYNAMQIGIFGLFGAATAGFMADQFSLTAEWYVWCFIGAAIIAVLGWLQIDLNAKVLGVALVLEVLVIAVFDFAILADPGPEGLRGVGFSPGAATETALGAALVFTVASFVGFESAAIYSEEAKDPKRTVARATFIAVAAIGVFYAISSWLLANAVGPDTIVDPGALVEGGYTVDGENPDPTTALFVTGGDRLGTFYADVATALFCTSLFAALLAFHNNVARYFYALGREGVIPKAFGRVNRRTGAPFVGSATQTVLAVTVIAVFAILEEDPVLKLFTWLTNMGALGVIVLMAVTSFAVVAYFRKRPDHELGAARTVIAPMVAGVLLVAILVLGVLNFNVLITGSPDAPTDTMAVVLPLILLVAGVVGMIVAALMQRSRPAAYAQIGERTVTEEVEHVA